MEQIKTMNYRNREANFDAVLNFINLMMSKLNYLEPGWLRDETHFQLELEYRVKKLKQDFTALQVLKCNKIDLYLIEHTNCVEDYNDAPGVSELSLGDYQIMKSALKRWAKERSKSNDR